MPTVINALFSGGDSCRLHSDPQPMAVLEESKETVKILLIEMLSGQGSSPKSVYVTLIIDVLPLLHVKSSHSWQYQRAHIKAHGCPADPSIVLCFPTAIYTRCNVYYTWHGNKLVIFIRFLVIFQTSRTNTKKYVCMTGTPLCMQSPAFTHFWAHQVFLFPVNQVIIIAILSTTQVEGYRNFSYFQV